MQGNLSIWHVYIGSGGWTQVPMLGGKYSPNWAIPQPSWRFSKYLGFPCGIWNYSQVPGIAELAISLYFFKGFLSSGCLHIHLKRLNAIEGAEWEISLVQLKDIALVGKWFGGLFNLLMGRNEFLWPTSQRDPTTGVNKQCWTHWRGTYQVGSRLTEQP